VLGIITNVAAASGYTSTLHLYDISTPTRPAPIAVSTPTAVSALSLAIDSGNDVAYLTQDVPATTATYHICSPPNYSCAVVGPSGAIPGGQLLTVDGLGNAYATQLSGENSGVIKFNLGAGPSSASLVYTSVTQPGAYYGLVASAGGTVYVAEGPANAVNGAGITIHACSSPCAAGGTDITASLRTSMGSPTANFSGALGVDGIGDLVVGLSNSAGSSNTASTVTIAIVCATPSSTFQCQSTSFLSGAFTSVGGFNPWDGTAGIAVDPDINIYTAAFLHGDGSTTPLPSIYAYADNDTFQTFQCGTTTGSPAVPNCPINELPGPPVYTQGAQPAPYSIAATHFSSL
jgi:hypothetical protein